MKKTLTKALLVLTTLSLVGCGSSANVSFANEELVSGAVSVTKGQLFEDFKKQDGAKTYVLQEILEVLAEKEGFDIDEIKADAQEQIDQIKETSPTYVEYYGEETLLKYYIASEYEEKLFNQYIEINFDELVSENPSFYANIATFSSEEEANTALESINAGTDFAEACAAVDSTISADAEVYMDDDENLPVEVKEFVNSTDSGLSDVIVASSSTTTTDGTTIVTNTYYLINLISKNVEDYKDEFVSYMSSEIESATVYNYYFEKYNVQIYDQDIYEALSEVYDSLK